LLAIENEVLEMVVCGQPLKSRVGCAGRPRGSLSGEMFCTILFHQDREGTELECLRPQPEQCGRASSTTGKRCWPVFDAITQLKTHRSTAWRTNTAA
jgi:hypothetical protein